MLYEANYLAELEARLRSALPLWGASETANLKLLSISENATYLVDDAKEPFVLRVARPGYNSQAEILSELAWIDALRGNGVVPTPAPLPARDGRLLVRFDEQQDEAYAVAFEFMSGSEPQVDGDIVTWFERLGATAARLHLHTRHWARPDGFVRKRWTFDALLGRNAFWGDWRLGLGLRNDDRDMLESVREDLEERARVFGMDEDRFGLVHCDMRPANLLVEGERLAVIDFDDCGFCWFGYDFAAALGFLACEPITPALMQAWLLGYRSVTPFAPEQAAMLPAFAMMRRMQLMAWIASHAETPTAQALGPDFTTKTVALGRRFLDTNGTEL